MKPMPAGARTLAHDDLEDGVIFLGILGMIDPPRDDAIAAVAECRAAGIRVKMITGDHASTASAIGRQLGLLDHDRVTTGDRLDGLDSAALREVAEQTSVFARTSPEHKLSIVEALQARRCGGGDDRRRRQRRAGAQARRRRHRHGPQGHRSRQGGGRDGASRRQLRLDRRRRPRRAHRLRQSQEGHRLDAADQRRRSAGDPRRYPRGAGAAGDSGPDPVDQHDHGRCARADAGFRADGAWRDGKAADGHRTSRCCPGSSCGG